MDPPEVVTTPDDYACIGQEITEKLQVIPQSYQLHRTIRRKYKHKTDRSLAPIVAPAPVSLIDNSYASVSLLTDIILKKYVDHFPLYRQERILQERFRIHLSRKTICDWVGIVSDWLKPIYNHMRRTLQAAEYLQIDETPIQYLSEEAKGTSQQSYLWVYHHPGSDVFYEWHRSRSAECLKTMLEGFSGPVQCDEAYLKLSKECL